MDRHVVPTRIKDECRKLGPVRVQEPTANNVTRVLINFGVVREIAFPSSDATLSRYGGQGKSEVGILYQATSYFPISCLCASRRYSRRYQFE